LQKDRTFIKTVGGPENRQARPRVSANDGPVDGTGPAIERQQRGVILNHAVSGNGDEFLRGELQYIGHDAEIGIEGTKSLARLLGFQGAELENRDLTLLRGQP
jgi:hypothetical protein